MFLRKSFKNPSMALTDGIFAISISALPLWHLQSWYSIALHPMLEWLFMWQRYCSCYMCCWNIQPRGYWAMHWMSHRYALNMFLTFPWKIHDPIPGMQAIKTTMGYHINHTNAKKICLDILYDKQRIEIWRANTSAKKPKRFDKNLLIKWQNKKRFDKKRMRKIF